LGRLGGPIDPAKDIVAGANRDYFCLNSGLTITGRDGDGVGLCPLDASCVSLGAPGLWKFSLEDPPRQPSVFVNLYNNEWNTNFPEWQGGSWTSRVRLWPTTKHASVADALTVPSWEARLPLLAVAADGPAGTLPQTQTGLTLSRKGVLVTAFGANPDGNGTVLRVWEQSGVSGEITATLPGIFRSATPVNLRGEKLGEPLPIKDCILTFPLKAYAPASFILE
jgi:alpha-mannosidase